MEKLDPALREAARDLGAGPLRSFLSVVLPETLPGVMSGLAMTFVPSTGMFFISDLLGGGTNMLLGNLINNQLTVSRDWPFGAALSILMVGILRDESVPPRGRHGRHGGVLRRCAQTIAGDAPDGPSPICG